MAIYRARQMSSHVSSVCKETPQMSCLRGSFRPGCTGRKRIVKGDLSRKSSRLWIWHRGSVYPTQCTHTLKTPGKRGEVEKSPLRVPEDYFLIWPVCHSLKSSPHKTEDSPLHIYGQVASKKWRLPKGAVLTRQETRGY